MTKRTLLTETGEITAAHESVVVPVADRTLEFAVKRTFDLLVAVALLLIMTPLLMVIAVAVKASSRGPAFFRHSRVGRHGDTFTMLKFRTMVHDTSERIHNDPSLHQKYVAHDFKLPGELHFVTPVGRLLRKTSLDELPQLLHVVSGRMSLVGIRPVEPAQLASRSLAAERAYRAMRPGLTGLWQVRGRSTLTTVERCRLDTEYVERWTLGEDIAILLRTPAALLRFSETV